ncbi:MAG: extracellular solute-binding protein, partial [Thaumarchaeota archaeon]|nr:extracellular solute-binding protein [Nitrososphaerota archaeon]
MGLTQSTSTTQYSTLPDYKDFLTWLHSVSSPYSGKSLNLTLEAEFGSYSAQLLDGDFYNATGIRDQYDIKPYSLQLQEVSLMFSTKSGSYDVYSLDVENLGVFPNDSFSPYELAQKYPDLTYPNLDFNDFNRNCWDRIATYPPDLRGGNGGSSATNVPVLPFDTPTMVLFYRTDVFDQLGLTPPANWDDHFANCQAIQKAGLTPFGSVSMAGTDISIIYEYQAHLSSFGGVLWDFDGNTIIPAMNNDKAIA